MASVSVLLAFFIFLAVAYSDYKNVQIDELLSDLRLLSSFDGDYSGLQFKDRRFTVISPDGSVLYDSMVSGGLENHSSRPEVVEAFAYGSGYDIRRSTTVLENMLYAAVLAPDGNVIRLSRVTSSIYSYILGMIPSLLFLLFLLIILSACISFRISRIICVPINNIDLEHPAQSGNLYDELAPLARRIEHQNNEISGHLRSLERDKNEFALITGSMQDGFMVVRRGGAVVSMNGAAKRLLGKNPGDEFSSILEVGRYPEFFTILEGGTVDSKIDVGGRVLEIRSALVEGIGSAVFIFDVSEKEALDRKEREFVQNVSHELRTPLTSISGYSELIASGKTDEAHIAEFSRLINKEAVRLARLIDDILDLSRLENVPAGDFSEVDLGTVAADVASSFSGKKLEIVSDHPVHVSGRSDLIFEAVYNLVDNAFKYNRDDNTVTITVSGPSISVADRGIGLSPGDRLRVFDRFYRVDKSRSRETGGTGLGLSIVKRIADMHGADISISSTLGEGTVITISLLPWIRG